MTHDETLAMLDRMEKYGGSFVRALALAWRQADEPNECLLETAFAWVLEVYGPDNPMAQAPQ